MAEVTGVTGVTVIPTDQTQVGSFRVSVLGTLSAESRRGSIHVSGAHRRCLLALLASRAGHVVGVDTIVDTLWGDDPPPSAVKTVQSHVLRLRRSLRDAGPQVIETAPGGYRLAIDRSAVDVGRFEDLVREGRERRATGDHVAAQESLAAALELWRGPAYLEFRDTQFGSAEGARLGELFFGAREDLAAAQIASGSAASAVAGLERLVHDAPGRELAWELLMKALYATGRQHDALGAFQRARRALAEFGLEPGADLCETERWVLDKHPALDAVSGPTMLAAALRTSSALIGRAHERRELAAAWQAAKSGTGQVRLVTGPLESGRTRLVADLAGRAIADGGVVDYARGDESLVMLERTLSGGGAHPDTGRTLDAIAERCRERPVLLIVDDAEWATGAAVEVIRAIAQAVDQMALLVVLVIDPSAGGPAVTALGRLDPSGAGTILVEPMSEDELAAVITADGVDPSAVSAIVAMANGLPGVARREGAIWAERTASERLRTAAASSIGATAIAQRAHTSVLDEVVELVEARARRDELWSSRWAGRQPYRALSTYGLQDAELFVGRERLVAELAARVLERRLVVVVGASGSGKSSLLRAGLVPLARSGRLPGSVPWATHVIVPGFDPIASLNAIDELDEPGPQLLVVDQFEEAFTAPPPTIERFAGRLLDLTEDPDLDVHVVLVVRSDEYDKLTAQPTLGEPASRAPVVVGPPTDDEIRRIVAEPARRTGTSVEPALVDLVASDVAGYESALPLVSAAMAEVWEQRDAGVMRCARYIELGGLATVVERLGDQALVEAGDEHVDAVRRVLLALADISDDGVWTRRRVPVHELSHDAAAIEALVNSRLVVRTDDTIEIIHEVVFRAWPQLATWLEEARADLIVERELRRAARSWDSAGRPDDHLYRGIRLHAALEWADRSSGPAPVALTEFLVAGRELGERHEQEIRAQLHREQRARRRATRALGVAAVLLVLALVAVGLAAISRNNAMEAEQEAVAAKAVADAERATADDARQVADEERANAEEAQQATAEQRDLARVERLVAESELLLPSQFDLAGLLAVEARRHADTPDTRGALLTELAYTMPTSTRATIPSRFIGYIQPPANVGDGGVGLDLSADGTVLAASSFNPDGSQLTVYDVRDRRVLASADVPLLLQDIDVSADGTYVVGFIEHADDPTPPDTLVILDVGTGATTFLDYSNPVEGETFTPRVRLTPDGARAIALRHDGSLTAWDVATGTLAEQPLPGGPFDWFDVTPDGLLVALSRDLVVSWFDLTTGELVRQQVVGGDGADLSDASQAVSPDGRTLAIGQWQGPLFLWDLTTGAPIPDEGGRPDRVRTVSFDPADPNVLAITTATGDLVFFDVADNSAIGDPVRVHGNGMRDVSFNASGTTMAAFADDRRISLWGDGASPGLIDSALIDDVGLDKAVYSPDGRRVLFFGGDRAEVRDSDNLDAPGIPLTPEGGGEPGYYLGRFDGGGNRVFLGTGAEDISDYVADALTGEVVWSAPPGTGIRDISPDGGTVVLIRGQRIVELWDVEADRQLASAGLDDLGLDGNFSGPLSFSADGRFVDAVSDAGALRFEVPSLALATVVEIGRSQCTVARVAGSDFLVAMDGPGRVSWLDMADGVVAGTGVSHDSTSICGIGASSDGSIVAAHQAFTQHVALFDTASMRPIGTPIPVGAGDGFLTPAFADDTHMVDVGAAGGLSKFDLRPDTWQTNVCQQVGRNLTAAEWTEYIGTDEPYRVTCPQWPSGQ